MKSVLIVIILLLFQINIISQEEESVQYIDLHFNPLTLLDFTPRIRLGLEYNNLSKLSYNIELGLGNNLMNYLRNGNSNISDYKLLEIRPEIKYNFYKIDPTAFYTSLEFFYISASQTMENGSYSSQDFPGTIYFERANLFKSKYGSHLKIGLHSSSFDRINLDIYFGMGMARRIFNYSNIINPDYTDDNLFVEWVPQAYRFEGNTNLFHLTAGFKIGIILWKKQSE